MLLKRISFLFLCIWSVNVFGQTNIKAMFYNLLNYDATLESENRTPFLKTILQEIQPDVFMVCELKSETASDYLFENAIVPTLQNFKKAPFLVSKSPAKDLLQMVYYNSTKLTLEFSRAIPTETRDINHYTFRLNSENASKSPIKIEVFVTHLKASTGKENRIKRYNAAFNFARELETLPANSNVLFAGDFNFYTSNEEGFLRIINPTNPIKIIDPIERMCPEFPKDGKDYFDEYYDSFYFWNNNSFSNVHSQSTRTSGGGMDDRFDFIMMSENLKNSNTLFYKTNSYTTIGNNGNCYNSYVSNSDCIGKYSQNLRNALYEFSDHLPIVMQLETPENILSYQTYQPIYFLTSNSSSDTLTIKITSTTIKKILIYNQLGQLVKNIEIKNQTTINIDTRDLSNGIYFIKADTYKPTKFIKL